MGVQLDPERLDRFAAALTSQPGMRVGRQGIKCAFDEAFPDHPAGADGRRHLGAALETLARRGVIALPSVHGRRWDRLLGVTLPTSVEVLRAPCADRPATWRSFAWHPRLSWVSDLRALAPEHEMFLRRVHDGLAFGLFRRRVPLTYRSLQLTGHKKRLAELCGTELFGPTRLTLDLLGCMAEVLPLAWERVSDGGRVLVLQSTALFNSAREVIVSSRGGPYGIVVHGADRRVAQSLSYLATIEEPVDAIEYVGDIDREGLRLARLAVKAAASAGLPRVDPAQSLHYAMLEAAARFGAPLGWRDGRDGGARDDDAALLSWLPGDVRSRAREIIGAGRRVPEEVLGPAELEAIWCSGRPAPTAVCKAIYAVGTAAPLVNAAKPAS
jgi:hypothetical protein